MNKLWQDKKEGVISWLVLLGVLLLIFLLLLGPVLHHADRYRFELGGDARVLQQLRAIEAVQDEIAQVQQDYQQRDLQGWVYTGQNASDISLDVQRRVSDWLSVTQVQRITPVRVKADNNYEGLGVQVQFTSSMEELLAVIQQIEQSRPLLAVERMRVSPIAQRSRRNHPEPPQRVNVQMTIHTYVAMGGEP